MNKKEILEKLKEFTTIEAGYGDFLFPIEVCEMNIAELYHLLITNEGNTKNVLSEIKELEKWKPFDVDKQIYVRMDAIFRWEAVNNNRQLMAFEVEPPTGEAGIKECYLLLSAHEMPNLNKPKPKKNEATLEEAGCYIGLKFKRDYRSAV